MIQQLRAAVAAVALAACAGQAAAGALSFAGTFSADDSVAILNFSVTQPGTVTLETFSYAGGFDAVRGPVAAGGFDPLFGLFSSAGELLGIGDDGATRIDPVTFGALDALLSTSLDAGDYFVALAQYDNYPVGPSFADGFLRSGAGNFTSAFACAAGRFCDVNGSSRTANYDLLISGAGIAAVPEPGTWALMSAALAGLAGWARRRRKD